ncbi:MULTISPECIES: Hsp70 family protein [unclassified Streptomyces]|uniref:Hsp70 family protein n=1 Tax=unclassified Streptomyces TaxID=2593676 RepID=UPI00225774C7|nr:MULTISPECIES: Hsp70 family protein [unclassified Streptomyces]MCX5051832.1 Hsp70 family protein [Streptomyces sp. NBC_00474]
MTASRGPDGQGHELGLGLDLGSTGLRAAFGRPGGPVRRFTLSGARWPWLLCEPSVTGPLPVTFPSLKSRLGSGRPVLVDGVPTGPEEEVAGLLREARERAETEAGGRVTLTVISVPVSYGSAQRTALLDAARAAGLDSVRLIGDAMAAVVGHTEGRGSTTCLVYGLGYGGFELGLIRGARGRYRALGHESASSTGGRAFDDAALTGMLRAARRRANPARLEEADWLRLRARVERIREELCASGGAGGALLELDLGGGIPAQLQYDREVLAEYLERHVRRTLARAGTLLDQSAMDRRDVDTLLLVGGGTRLEEVRSGVRGLARETVLAPADLLATGALLHASQLAGIPSTPLEGLAVEPSDTSEDTLSEAPHLSVTLLSPPAPAACLDVGLARRLAEQGRVEEARTLLETILSEARGLLDSLDTPGAQGSGPMAPQEPGQRPAHSSRSAGPLADRTGLTSTRPAAGGGASAPGVPVRGSEPAGPATGHSAAAPGSASATGETGGQDPRAWQPTDERTGTAPESAPAGRATNESASAGSGTGGAVPTGGRRVSAPNGGPAATEAETEAGAKASTGTGAAGSDPRAARGGGTAAGSPSGRAPFTRGSEPTRPAPGHTTSAPHSDPDADASTTAHTPGPPDREPKVPTPGRAPDGLRSDATTSTASTTGYATDTPDHGPTGTAPRHVAADPGAGADPRSRRARRAPGDAESTDPGPTDPEPTDAEHWADLKAVRRLTVARDLLTEGRYEEAVQASHAAWQAAGDGTTGADVLDAMIAVHCAAAMADFSPEHFTDAERWLRCAYGHDPTNARVRELLAERTFRHAERLAGRGRRDDAVEALHQCLTWNPEHASAQALLERISRRGRNHRDRGGVPR